MVPDSDRSQAAAAPDDRPPTGSDGGSASDFDEAALYSVVRAAVKDALLDVIGTVLLVGIAFVLVTAGSQAALQSSSTAGVALGVGVAVAGIYLAAATLELVPPVRDWL